MKMNNPQPSNTLIKSGSEKNKVDQKRPKDKKDFNQDKLKQSKICKQALPPLSELRIDIKSTASHQAAKHFTAPHLGTAKNSQRQCFLKCLFYNSMQIGKNMIINNMMPKCSEVSIEKPPLKLSVSAKWCHTLT